jgi:hypothetical protein
MFGKGPSFQSTYPSFRSCIFYKFSTNNLSSIRYCLLAWSNSFCRQLIYCADGHGIGGVRHPPHPPLATPLPAALCAEQQKAYIYSCIFRSSSWLGLTMYKIYTIEISIYKNPATFDNIYWFHNTSFSVQLLNPVILRDQLITLSLSTI